ncbi:MAG: DUF4405 domain-containing protein [bacterium]
MRDLRSILLIPATAALGFVTCALVGTGLLLELRLDAEDGAVRILGLGPDDWSELHFCIALGFLLLTALHLFLNWAWIISAVSKARWILAVIVVGVLLVAALLLWPAEKQTAGWDTWTRLLRECID